MKLTHLEIQNFLSVGEATVEFQDQGLVHVEGVNLDEDASESNGAGKSSIFTEALLWCWYGITSRGVKHDQVVHKQAGKGTMVRSYFEQGGHTYVVTRYRKHAEGGNNLIVHRDGEDISRSTAAVTGALVVQTVGMDAQTYMHTITLGQGMSRRLSQLTDAGRKEVIEGVTRLDIFERARKRVRELCVVQEGLIHDTQEKQRHLDTQLTAKTLLIEKLQAANVEGWEQDLARARERVASLKLAVEKTGAVLEQVEATRAAMACATTEHPKLVDLQEELGLAEIQVNEAQENLGAARAIESDAQKGLNRRKDEERLVQVAMSSIEARKKSLEKALAKFEGSTECPTCLRPVDAEGRALIVRLFTDKIQAEAAELQPCQDQLERVRREIPLAELVVDNAKQVFTKALNDLRSVQQEQDSVKERHRALLGQLLREQDQRERDVQVAKREQERVRSELRGAEKTLVEVEKSRPKGVDPKLAQEQQKLETERDDLSLLLAEYGVELDVMAVALQVFSRMRSLALTDALQYLNARIAYYSGILTDGTMSATLTSTSETKTGKVADKIGLEVTTTGGAYESASGGEQDRIDLAISFALHDLVGRVSGVRHNVFVVDEPANFVDPVGIGRIVDLLEAKLEGGLESIFVVSQNPVFKGLLGTNWTVRKSAGYSELVTE